MRQILIVKSDTTLNNGITDGRDLTSLQNGALAVYTLKDYSPITEPPTTNFAIALGRPNGQAPFIIPEVDISTLKVTEVKPSDGSKFMFKFTITEAKANTDYTIRLFKKGVVPHERNSWTVQYRTGNNVSNVSSIAEKLKAQIAAKLSDKFDITASGTGAAITLEANSAWEVKLIDALTNATIDIENNTDYIPATGDKAYVENLAKFCAGGKGFYYTHSEGVDAIPGYPETVEDVKYTIYNLRFKINRDSSRTLDMGIWQEVNVAVPETSTVVINELNAIFFDYTLYNLRNPNQNGESEGEGEGESEDE